MNGGALVVSRAVNLFPHYKKRLEELGFKDVTLTNKSKDALNMEINDVKPHLVMMSAGFYQCSTPYMTSLLLRQFPNITLVSISLADYPADLAMWFIINGAQSYINYWDGIDEFYRGLEKVREGKKYISNSVLERIEMRRELPKPATEMTARQIEIVRLLCNGFTIDETADCLHISSRTVEAHRNEIYRKLNVRNENELIRAVLFLEIIRTDELSFFGGKYQLSPKPVKNIEQITGNK